MDRQLPTCILCGLVVLLLATGPIACQSDDQSNVMNMNVPFEKEGALEFLRSDSTSIVSIAIEIADTRASRERGLMYRRNLAMDQGMLFIFDDVSTGGFWMRNTYIPLDIIFVGPDSSVVSIARNTRIMSEKTIDPEGPRQFVVEVPAGFSKRYGIDTSTHVTWERTAPSDRSLLQTIVRSLQSLFDV